MITITATFKIENDDDINEWNDAKTIKIKTKNSIGYFELRGNELLKFKKIKGNETELREIFNDYTGGQFH
jgi:hypothetical protein